jgi:hypothetical protein
MSEFYLGDNIAEALIVMAEEMDFYSEIYGDMPRERALLSVKHALANKDATIQPMVNAIGAICRAMLGGPTEALAAQLALLADGHMDQRDKHLLMTVPSGAEWEVIVRKVPTRETTKLILPGYGGDLGRRH